MLKPEIRDPQGEAIAGACHRLGFGEVISVRQGKRFEVEVSDVADGSGGDAGAVARRVAGLTAELLGHPVNQGFAIPGGRAPTCGAWHPEIWRLPARNLH